MQNFHGRFPGEGFHQSFRRIQTIGELRERGVETSLQRIGRGLLDLLPLAAHSLDGAVQNVAPFFGQGPRVGPGRRIVMLFCVSSVAPEICVPGSGVWKESPRLLVNRNCNNLKEASLGSDFCISSCQPWESAPNASRVVETAHASSQFRATRGAVRGLMEEAEAPQPNRILQDVLDQKIEVQQYVAPRLKMHECRERFMKEYVHFQFIILQESFYLWVGTSDGKINNLEVSMMSSMVSSAALEVCCEFHSDCRAHSPAQAHFLDSS